MRIQPGQAGFGPGVGRVGGNPLVDDMMQAERTPLHAVAQRRERVVNEKNEYNALSGMLGDFGGVVNKLKTPAGFTSLKVDSSHPDILSGVVDGLALPGTYEFEVRGLAQSDKLLDVGFPDADQTAVGFGHLEIATAEQAVDVTIGPGSTLRDVADKINAAGAGVRAQIVDTGMAEEPFRLLVASEKTGEAAQINVDPDTTFLNMKNIKKAKDLNVKFEDVDVKRSENRLKDLVRGVQLDVKRAEPGIKVTVAVAHDVDKTMAGIKDFTSKYNLIAEYANKQFSVNSLSGKAGQLADGNMRAIMRGLQTQLSQHSFAGGKFSSMAEIGITTNAKTGALEVNEQKLKAALETDYDHVAKLFADSDTGQGVASKMADAVKRFKDPVSGVVANRLKTLDRQIKDQDMQIERQNQRLQEREEMLKRQLSAMHQQVATLTSQGQAMQARFGAMPPAAAPAGGA